MKIRSLILCALACAASFATAGCNSAPGKPGPDPEVARPEQVVDFPTLYAQNCAACHGVKGQNGAAISLANPVYIASAGVVNIRRVTAEGVRGTAMPPFARSSGGMLTDQQIAVLTHGIASTWSDPAALAGQTPPVYANSIPGDAARGRQVFNALCARCHGADAMGGKAVNGAITGSLVDPAYLALISDQALRSIIIAGQPEQGMPDWRHHLNGPAARPMTEQEIADVVAWLTSHRIANPGQPYQSHQ
jgi:cytochrome c oxidase cbb3-type subunit 3/ubiquinol-cytochrome c reductase cytochrome c subunit